MLAGITPNSPGAGTRPASCGRPRTRPFYASIPALCARSALRAHAHERRHPIVFGMPFGARPAHVIKFGPVRIEQASRQSLYEFGEIRQHASRPTLARAASNCLCHDPIQRDWRRLPVRSVPIARSAPLRVLSRQIC